MVKRVAQAKHCASKATRVKRIELQQSYVAKLRSDVVVSFDHNIFQRSSSQGTEEGSIVTLP